MTYMKSKIILEYIFENPSSYEIPLINDTFHTLAYNAVYTIDNEYRLYWEDRNNYTKRLKDEIHHYEIEIECYYLGIYIYAFLYI